MCVALLMSDGIPWKTTMPELEGGKCNSIFVCVYTVCRLLQDVHICTVYVTVD